MRPPIEAASSAESSILFYEGTVAAKAKLEPINCKVEKSYACIRGLLINY
jgi:hypothetical protein